MDFASAYTKAIRFARRGRPVKFSHKAFQAGIRENPEEIVRRGAYADWLEENDQHDGPETLAVLRTHDGPVDVGVDDDGHGWAAPSEHPPAFHTVVDQHVGDHPEGRPIRDWRDVITAYTDHNSTPWAELPPHQRRHYQELLGDLHAARVDAANLPNHLREYVHAGVEDYAITDDLETYVTVLRRLINEADEIRDVG